MQMFWRQLVGHLNGLLHVLDEDEGAVTLETVAGQIAAVQLRHLAVERGCHLVEQFRLPRDQGC